MNDLGLRSIWISRVGPKVPTRKVKEAYAFLVGAPVFKTGEGRHPVLVGSIPIRLRRADVGYAEVVHSRVNRLTLGIEG